MRGVSLAIQTRCFTFLSGLPDSGAGILLRLLGLLDRPDEGEIWIESLPTGTLDAASRLDLRNHVFGYLFAEPFLLDSFSVAENVAMPLFKISGFDIEQARDRTAQVLDFTGLASVADLGVADLSPLEHHKVALARALAVSPQILIAEDAGIQLGERDLRDFAGLLRTLPDLLGLSLIATSSALPRDFRTRPRDSARSG